jgi:hypothetical protein
MNRAILCALVFVLAAVSARAVRWTALKPEDLAVTQSAAGISQDAEVLSSSVELSFDGRTTTKQCYRRLKVYSARGVELVQKFGIDSAKTTSVGRLAARLTKPNGTGTEYSKADFYETALVKLGGEKWTTRRLLLSTLAPGDVVEFQWEEEWDGWAWFQLVYCQESLPVREFVLTMEVEYIAANFAWYNTPPARLKKPDASHAVLTINNLPAYEPEPDMPPELETRGHILIAYGEVQNNQAVGWLFKAYWLKAYAEKQAGTTDKIKALAESLCAVSDFNEVKLRKFYAYCREKIINIDYDDSPQSLKERVKRKDPQTAAQVLKQGRGNATEINFLFTALAASVGTDARIVCICPKDFRLTSDIDNGWYFSAPTLVACRQSGEWAFFNPGNPTQAFGELRWQEEGTTALMSGELEKLTDVTVPSTPARKNLTRRTATLQLAADGTLEGKATLNYTGQAALQWRIQHRKTPQAALEKELRDEITARIPGADIDQIAFENNQTPGQPLIVGYHLKIPNYATEAGARRFVVPNIFEVGTVARYTSEERHLPFFYPYAYQVEDEIQLVVPAGLVANDTEQPKTVSNDYLPLRQHISWQFDAGTNTLSYKREFRFGTLGSVSSKVMYVASAADVTVEAKKRRQVLHYYLDERLRSRNSQAIALEPAEPAPAPSVPPHEGAP